MKLMPNVARHGTKQMNDDPNLNPETDTPEPEEKPVEQPVAPAVNYAEKFAASTRENQLLAARIAELEKVSKELTKEPTDSEYRAAFPEWDALDDSQKADKRRIFNAERAALRAEATARELKDERARATSIELAIASHSALQGRESAFKQYASKPQYQNVPIDVLIDAFIGKNPVDPAPTPVVKKPSLLQGNGGPKTPDKPKTLSGKELKQLRESDYQAWLEYTSTHDIDLDEV